MLRLALWTIAMVGLNACGRTPDVSELASRVRTVHAALVNKTVRAPYFNRLAAPAKYLIVGPDPFFEADEQVDIVTNSEEELYIVEGQPLPLTKIEGEQARLDQFAVVAVPLSKRPHDFIGTHHLYMERVSDTVSDFDDERARASASALPQPDLNLEFYFDRADTGVKVSRLGPIDEAELTTWVEELSGAVPVSIGGRRLELADRRRSQGRDDARVYLRRAYEELGFTVREESYRSGFSQGVNLVATRLADEPGGGIVVLSSHLDSVGNAGADDNAAGTIAVLATAKALAGVTLRHELRIVAFDQEEDGLLGSAAYIRQLRQRGELEHVVANINVEMPAFDADDDGHLHVIDCNENRSDEITRRARAALVGIDPPLTIAPACTNRSDHASFWRAGRPAVVISQNFFGGDSNPCYHQACDRVDGVHFGYMKRVTTLIAKTAEALTSAQN